jgi:type VI protein secretion system component VasK
MTFFNRAAQASAALFTGSDPHFEFFARAVITDETPEMTLVYDTQQARFDKNTPQNRLVWSSSAGRSVKVQTKFSGKFRSTDRTVAQATGDWALFHVVAQAIRTDANGATVHAEWTVKQETVPARMDFVFPSGYPVIARGWLSNLACVSQVTR